MKEMTIVFYEKSIAMKMADKFMKFRSVRYDSLCGPETRASRCFGAGCEFR